MEYLHFSIYICPDPCDFECLHREVRYYSTMSTFICYSVLFLLQLLIFFLCSVYIVFRLSCGYGTFFTGTIYLVFCMLLIPLQPFPPSLCWENFLKGFVKNIFWDFELGISFFLYSYYSWVLFFLQFPEFLEVLCQEFLDLIFSLIDISVSYIVSSTSEIISPLLLFC